MGGDPPQFGRDPVVRRRSDDDATHRRGAVEGVAETAAQHADLELLRPGEGHLLADREEQFDAYGCRTLRQPVRERHQRGDRHLVVSAENRLAGVLPSPLSHDGLDRCGDGHRVEMCAEEQHALAAAGDARQQVAAVAPDQGPGAILGDREPEGTELAGDGVGARALASRRAGNPAERRESVVEAPALGLGGRRHVAPTTGCPPAHERRTDELAEERRRTLGARLELRVELRRDVEGCSGSSTTSTRRSSGVVPDITSPRPRGACGACC